MPDATMETGGRAPPPPLGPRASRTLLLRRQKKAGDTPALIFRRALFREVEP
jgi:hypothetical protein